MASPSAPTEAAILGRFVRPEENNLSPTAARAILKLEFDALDRVRMHELAVKNQDGSISPPELEELDNYIEAGDLMALLQSKARRALKHGKETATRNR